MKKTLHLFLACTVLIFAPVTADAAKNELDINVGLLRCEVSPP